MSIIEPLAFFLIFGYTGIVKWGYDPGHNPGRMTPIATPVVKH